MPTWNHRAANTRAGSTPAACPVSTQDGHFPSSGDIAWTARSWMPPLGAPELTGLWLVFQNVCFIFPQFLYQFFCGFSQQVSPDTRRQKPPSRVHVLHAVAALRGGHVGCRPGPARGALVHPAPGQLCRAQTVARRLGPTSKILSGASGLAPPQWGEERRPLGGPGLGQVEA